MFEAAWAREAFDDQYINEVYPYQKSKPNVIVLDYDEFEARDFMAVNSVYNIREETIYFKERPTPRDVCHEIEHCRPKE